MELVRPPGTATGSDGGAEERAVSKRATSAGRAGRPSRSKRRGPPGRRIDDDAPSQDPGLGNGSASGYTSKGLARDVASIVRLTEAVPVAVYAKDRSGAFIAANAQLLRLFGLEQGDVVGRRSGDVLPPHLAQEDEDLDARVLSGQSPQPIHFVWTTPDGGMQTLEGYKSEITSPSGGVAGTLAMVWDASERLGSEAALRQSEARLRTFFQICPVPMLELELSSTVSFVRGLPVGPGGDLSSRLMSSPADVDEASARLGITAYNGALLELFSARSFDEVERIMHENLVFHAREAFTRLLNDLSSGTRHFISEAVIRGADGSPHQVAIDFFKVAGDEVESVRGIACITDLTEAREKEEQFIEERRRSRLYLDLLVHDVRNLTQGVLTSLELISSGSRVTPRTTSLVDRARSHAERIADLVTKVSGISTFSQGMPVDKLMDLTSIVWIAVDRACISHRARELVVNFMPPRGKALVLANDVLEEVVIGLLDKVVSSTREGRTEIDIRLTASDDGKWWRLTMKDRGPGVADQTNGQNLGRNALGVDWEPGSDLGMVFAEHLVVCLGGRVWSEGRVSGEPSSGCRLVLELPAAP